MQKVTPLLLLVPLILGTFTKVFAQESDRLYTPKELKADLDFYFEMLYSNHPDPYYYCSLREFEYQKSEIYSQLEQPLNKEQFAWIIGEINSCVDRHSEIFIYTCIDPETIDKAREIKAFPIVRIVNGKVFFSDNIEDEIVEINGIATSSILSEMKKYYNWKLPHFVNTRRMMGNWADIILFKYKLKSPYEIRFSKENQIHIVEGIVYDEFLKKASASDQRLGTIGYSYKIFPNSSIAVFYIPTFTDSKKEEFLKTYKDFHKAVNEQKIKNIFYDLSMNGGGEHYGAAAVDIVAHDTVYFKLNKIKRENITSVKKYEVNEIVSLPNFQSDIPKDRKLFVLQGIGTTSNGDYFCRLVTENNLGILVGQNTGEPITGFTYSTHYEMPNTKIKFMIAAHLWDFSSYFDSETLQPDIYWDVNHLREFTEKELNDIINHYKKHVQIK